MRTLLAIPLLLCACTKAPAPGPVTPPKPEPVVRAPSCTDAGVLLRGSVSDEDKVGKLKEDLIAKVCTTDAWDAKVLACVASKAAPAECLSALTPTQVTSYEEKLAGWHEQGVAGRASRWGFRRRECSSRPGSPSATSTARPSSRSPRATSSPSPRAARSSELHDGRRVLAQGHRRRPGERRSCLQGRR